MSAYTLPHLFDQLWKDYVAANPPAQKIHDLFAAEGEEIINDHIAFRTYNLPAVNLDVVARPFVELGYQPKGDYLFEKKKLSARHFEHQDEDLPLIFISELIVEELDDQSQDLIRGLTSQIPEGFMEDPAFLFSGRPWRISYKNYQLLKETSEYAAWMAAFGFRANHFTVSVNRLNEFNDIRLVNQFLKDNGFQLNDSSGEVKGSPGEFLEQSSTLAYNKETEFDDGQYVIPSCYYEFAMRYPLPDGKLFRGFIAGSADKIFESTNKGQSFK